VPAALAVTIENLAAFRIVYPYMVSAPELKIMDSYNFDHAADAHNYA
jgi:hypothetical protein